MPGQSPLPMRNLQRPVQKSNQHNKSGKPPIKMIVILAVVVLLIIIWLVSTGGKSDSASSRVESEAIEYTTLVTTIYTEPEPTIVDTFDEDYDIIITTSDFIEKTSKQFKFNSSLTYPDSYTLSNGVSIKLSDDMTITPIKSCTYAYDVNKIDITHSSGAVLSIQRSGHDDSIKYDDMANSITAMLKKGSAKKINISNVYVGTKLCGKAGKGTVVDASGTELEMTLIDIYYSNCLYTMISLADDSSSDFIDLLLNNISFGNSKISIS